MQTFILLSGLFPWPSKINCNLKSDLRGLHMTRHPYCFLASWKDQISENSYLISFKFEYSNHRCVYIKINVCFLKYNLSSNSSAIN